MKSLSNRVEMDVIRSDGSTASGSWSMVGSECISIIALRTLAPSSIRAKRAIGATFRYHLLKCNQKKHSEPKRL